MAALLSNFCYFGSKYGQNGELVIFFQKRPECALIGACVVNGANTVFEVFSSKAQLLQYNIASPIHS